MIGAAELSVAVGGGPGTTPLDAPAYVLAAILCFPVLPRRRPPWLGLIACSVLLPACYTFGHRRNISPAPLRACWRQPAATG